MSTFLAGNSERHPTDLAKLHGARLVAAQETQKGRRWYETKIKALTGGETISARFMRRDFFDLTPVLKLIISGNVTTGHGWRTSNRETVSGAAVFIATLPKRLIQALFFGIYRRTEEKFVVPHTGAAVCTVCGAALEFWSENKPVPSYEFIECPVKNPAR